MSSFSDKTKGYKTRTNIAAQDWANHYQPEIDSLRNTGQPLKRGVWEGVKHWASGKGKEWRTDWHEMTDPRYNWFLEGENDRDGDDERWIALEKEKAQALRDHQKNIGEDKRNAATYVWDKIRSGSGARPQPTEFELKQRYRSFDPYE